MFDLLVVKVNNNTHRTELQIRLEAFLTSSVAYNRVCTYTSQSGGVLSIVGWTQLYTYTSQHNYTQLFIHS